jgi:peptidoglycan/LPS O-acetylase OafA/YrhL
MKAFAGAMASETRPRMVDEPGVLFGIATGTVVATELLAGACALPPAPTALALVIVAGLFGARLRALLATALGVIAWAFYTGFTQNRLGQLTLATGDLTRVGAFAVGVLAVALVIRRMQTSTPQGAAVRRG